MSEKSNPDMASSSAGPWQFIPEKHSQRRRKDVITSLRAIVSQMSKDQMASVIQRNEGKSSRKRRTLDKYTSSPYLPQEVLEPASRIPIFDLTCLLLDEAERLNIPISQDVRDYRNGRSRENNKLSTSMEDVLYGAMPGYPPVRCGNCASYKVPCVPCHGDMSTCTSCKRLDKGSCMDPSAITALTSGALPSDNEVAELQASGAGSRKQKEKTKPGLQSACTTRSSGQLEDFTGSFQVSLPNDYQVAMPNDDQVSLPNAEVAEPQASVAGSRMPGLRWLLQAPAKNTGTGQSARTTLASGEAEPPSASYQAIPSDDETAYPWLNPFQRTTWPISRELIEPGIESSAEPETDHDD